MKKAIILNLPFKADSYSEKEVMQFEKWIRFFAGKDAQVIVTPPAERKDLVFTESVTKLENIHLFFVPSFDTCDRWKAGLLKALENPNTDPFYLWSADFQFSELSTASADKLFEHENGCDFVVGTIEATGTKERIDTLGTFPLLHHWFHKESDLMIKKGFYKPRSELLRLSRKFLEFALAKRWYPSEQTINLILQCLWNEDLFTMKSMAIGEIKDADASRETSDVVEQIERMELWLKYMWRNHNRNWAPDKYQFMCGKSHQILQNAIEHLLFTSRNKYFEQPEDNYRFIIEDAWRDIHHSRNQDWTALGVVFAAHFGILKFVEFLNRKIPSSQIDNDLYIIGGAIGFVLAFIGALVAFRHRSLLKLKMKWITSAEIKLGLLKTDENPDGIIDPQRYQGISNSWLIVSIYLFLMIVDIFTVIHMIR